MTATSIDKALEVCEALSRSPRGASVGELARALGLPAPTVHRLLAVLKRRGYVRQDEETQRYGLTLKMLDLSFQFLGRSELRLHAYPVLREYVLGSGLRAFIAIPAADEVTYVWATGPDEVAMRTVYGKAMPAHCAALFLGDPGDSTVGLSAARSARRCRRRRCRVAASRATGGGWRGAAPGLHLRASGGLHGPRSGAARHFRSCGRRDAVGDYDESRRLGAGATGLAAAGMAPAGLDGYPRLRPLASPAVWRRATWLT